VTSSASGANNAADLPEVQGYLDEVTNQIPPPIKAKYTGVLAAADIEIFVWTTARSTNDRSRRLGCHDGDS